METIGNMKSKNYSLTCKRRKQLQGSTEEERHDRIPVALAYKGRDCRHRNGAGTAPDGVGTQRHHGTGSMPVSTYSRR